MRQDRVDDVRYWIREREKVAEAKNAGKPWPWSDDPAFRTIRFCNVRREDDKVTRWIATNWRNPYKDFYSIPLAMSIARLVNWPDTLAELQFPEKGWTPEYRQHFLDVLAARKARGDKVWTSAYMVTGGYSKGGESKEVIIARVLDGAASASQSLWSCHTMADSDRVLTVPGIGGFLRGQILADLKYTDLLADAPDWWTWCNPGPGSTAGMNILIGRNKTLAASIPLKEFRENVNALASENLLHAQDMQNVLCEFSKWWKFTHDGIRPKNRYIQG